MFASSILTFSTSVWYHLNMNKSNKRYGRELWRRQCKKEGTFSVLAHGELKQTHEIWKKIRVPLPLSSFKRSLIFTTSTERKESQHHLKVSWSCRDLAMHSSPTAVADRRREICITWNLAKTSAMNFPSVTLSLCAHARACQARLSREKMLRR